MEYRTSNPAVKAFSPLPDRITHRMFSSCESLLKILPRLLQRLYYKQGLARRALDTRLVKSPRDRLGKRRVSHGSLKAFSFSGLLISTWATYSWGKVTLKYSNAYSAEVIAVISEKRRSVYVRWSVNRVG